MKPIPIVGTAWSVISVETTASRIGGEKEGVKRTVDDSMDRAAAGSVDTTLSGTIFQRLLTVIHWQCESPDRRSPT